MSCEERIRRAADYIAAMRVDHENQELAVMAKQELKACLEEMKHEYTARKEMSSNA